MVKKFILAIVALLVLVAAAGGISYALGILRAPELEGITLSWGKVTPATTTIDANVDVNNRLPFGIGVGSVGIEVPIYIHDIKAAEFGRFAPRSWPISSEKRT